MLAVTSRVRQVTQEAAASRVCTAAEAGDWTRTLSSSEALSLSGTELGQVSECRCRALFALGRAEECITLVASVLRETGDGWLPPPALSLQLLQRFALQGEADRAAELARRAARAAPENLDLAMAELVYRAAAEGEEVVLQDLAARVAEPSATAYPPRIALAHAFMRRREFERVVEILQPIPPRRVPKVVSDWLLMRVEAQLALNRAGDARETYALWQRHIGGDPLEAQLHYALMLSLSGSRDPNQPTTQLLREALEVGDRVSNRYLVQRIYERLIAHLIAEGSREEALEIFDAASREFDLSETISRPQILASQPARTNTSSKLEQADASSVAPRGSLEFTLPAGAAAGSLWVGPDLDHPPDALYQLHALAGAKVARVERRVSSWPVRWVFRDTEQQVLASGAAWVAADQTHRVEISPGAPQAMSAPFEPALSPADGRRRVFVVILDCGDWRLVQYLRSRGELPVHGRLLSEEYRAVLTSRPPLTAAAMEFLVWPERGRTVSVIGLVHRLGLEIGGLASVGSNPVDFLRAFRPEGLSLFEKIGAERFVTANMLLTHGSIDAGRNAKLIGPNGLRHDAQPVSAVRALSAEERSAFPRLTDPIAEQLAEAMAAQFDAAADMARRGRVDLLMLRIESFDVLTHTFYGRLAQTRQDDGDAVLLDAYRYADRRIGELWSALDADDVLIVMSDHGIRSALDHAEDAFFVAAGPGIPHARAEGQPHLAGLPRVLAGLFGIDTDWPDTGVAAWDESPTPRQ